MGTVDDLGTIEYEQNLNEVWSDEPGGFTPWLETNIDLLSEALGLELEIEQREAPVGSFKVDLVGRELSSDRAVIIENQLGESDHDHLGKLITYWAGRGAGIAIWIARRITDAHREAIHRLNKETSEGIDAFAVEIELMRIGCSPLAPHFSVVERPRPKLTRPPSEYREFHTDLLRRLHGASVGFSSRSAGDTPFLVFRDNLPRGFRFATAFQRNRAKVDQFEVELVIEMEQRTASNAAFDQLWSESDEIEKQIEEGLEWKRVSEHSDLASRVFAHRTGGIDSSPERLEEFKQWAVDLLPKFRDAFAPRIAALDLDALTAAAAATEEVTP